MKAKKNILISIIIFLFLLSCKKTYKVYLDNGEQLCLPGFIWINYVGETNKIKRFTIIRTTENDSSYISYYKKEWVGFANDSLFFNIYCNDYIVDSNLFYKLKHYITVHNTHKKEEPINVNNYNAVKVVFIDKCDSIEYIVNREVKGYFSKMIDSLEIKEKTFIGYLDYYENIINP